MGEEGLYSRIKHSYTFGHDICCGVSQDESETNVITRYENATFRPVVLSKMEIIFTDSKGNIFQRHKDSKLKVSPDLPPSICVFFSEVFYGVPVSYPATVKYLLSDGAVYTFMFDAPRELLEKPRKSEQMHKEDMQVDGVPPLI